MQPEASNNPSKNEAKQQHEKSTILAPKMEPKWRHNEYPMLARRLPETRAKKNLDFLSILDALGRQLASFWRLFEPIVRVKSPDLDQN